MNIIFRLGWFLLGCVIGFVIGYIVRSLRNLESKVDEVDNKVSKGGYGKEGGFARTPFVQDIALLLVIVLTVWASFSSQKSSNDVKDTQAQTKRVVSCTQDYLDKMLVAVNARTEYSSAQAQANLDLQQKQAVFLGFLLQKPPPDNAAANKALQEYYEALVNFNTVGGKNATSIANNQYPTASDYNDCLNGK